MRSSHEVFEAIPDFANIFEKYILPALSHRERLNTRSSCRLFREVVPLHTLLARGKVLPSLSHYSGRVRRSESVTCYLIGEHQDDMFTLINKSVYKDQVKKYLSIDKVDQNFIDQNPESLSITTTIQDVTLKITSFKSDYYFRNLHYSSDSLFYLVCDISNRDELNSVSNICAEIKTYCCSDKSPVVILLAVKPSHHTEENITHSDLEELARKEYITNWFKVNLANNTSISKAMTYGLRYVMRDRYPAIKEQLENHLLGDAVNDKAACCTIS